MASKRKPLKLDLEEGGLHKDLGVSPKKKIPKGKINAIAKAKIGTKVNGKQVTTKLKRRATFAKNAAKWNKK